MGKISAFAHSHPWRLLAIGMTLALLVGVGIGLGEEPPPEDTTEVEALAAEVEQLQAELDQAGGEAEAQESLMAEVEARRDELDEREAAIEEAEAQLERRLERQQRQRQRRQRERERQAQRTTIGDGIWEAGKDFQPGTYRAPGGGSCYWAKLRDPSGEFDSIIANGGFTENQTVQVDSPWFETRGCGTWEKM